MLALLASTFMQDSRTRSTLARTHTPVHFHTSTLALHVPACCRLEEWAATLPASDMLCAGASVCCRLGCSRQKKQQTFQSH